MRLLLIAVLALALPWQAAAEERDLPNFPLIEVTTNLGTFVLELDTRRAPVTVRNFVDYVEDGFYDGLIFHRVVQGFVVQAGAFDTEFESRESADNIINESGNGLGNQRGTIAMARTNDPHSANSQFYINLVDNASLNPSPSRWGYAVFGRVVRGMAVVDAIGDRSTGPGGPFPQDVPVSAVVIEQARMLSRDEYEQEGP